MPRKRPEMPKVSEAHQNARRKQILEAANRCFSRRGFQATTTREICREAKLSPGAVYSYFESKDAIIESLAEAYGRPRQELASVGLGETGMVASEVLAKGFGCVLDGLTEKGAERTARLDVRIWSEAIDNRTLRRLLTEALARLREPWAQAVRQGQAVGDVNPDLDPAAIAQVMVAMTLGLEVLTVFGEDFDVSDTIEAAQSLIRGRFVQGPSI
jgi:AcrR family transcriptional regulator